MNTATLMTISPQAGAAVKSQTPRMVAKTDASSAGTSKETFGDVLGKAGEDVKKAMAKSPAEAQGSAVEARDADINDDVPEGTMNRPQDGGKRGEGTPQGNKPQEQKDVKGSGERTPDPAESGMAPAAVMAFSMEGNAQLLMEEMPEAEEIQSSQNLQSLLPQSSDEAQKNKNFLAMLSGQQIKTQNSTTNEGQVVNRNIPMEQAAMSQGLNAKAEPLTADLLFRQMGMQPVENGEAAQVSTLLEMQLDSHRLANQLAGTQAGDAAAASVNTVLAAKQDEALGQMAPNQRVDVSDRGKDTVLNAKGMALFQQSEETMPSRAVGEVINQADLLQARETGAVLNQSMARAVREEGAPGANDLFAGVKVTVEETLQQPQMTEGRPEAFTMPSDKMPIRENLAAAGQADTRQEDGKSGRVAQLSLAAEEVPETVQVLPGDDARQMDGRQGRDSRQQPPVMPTLERFVDKDGNVLQQLPEEAAGDKAAPAAQSSQESQGPASAFQQSLMDNVKGADRLQDAQSPRDVQDNFQVARQIVEQARLIRRAENTEMVIKLHPDHLGELTLKVSVTANGSVNASFHSDNAQVRTIIENSLVMLKQELNNQGLKVDNVDVYAGLGDGQLPQGEGQQNQSHNNGSNAASRTGGLEEYGSDETAAAAPTGTDAADGVDYRV